MVRFALAGVLAVLAAGSGGAADGDKGDPSGTWKWAGKVGKKDAEQTLKLEVKDGKVSGTLSAGKLALKVEDGTFKDGELEFTAVGEQKGEKVVAKFTGKLTGDTIKGTETVDTKGKMKGKPQAWEAKRDTPEKKKD